MSCADASEIGRLHGEWLGYHVKLIFAENHLQRLAFTRGKGTGPDQRRVFNDLGLLAFRGGKQKV